MAFENRLYVTFVNFLRHSDPSEETTAYFGPPILMEFHVIEEPPYLKYSGRYLILPFKNPQNLSINEDRDLVVSCSGTIDFTQKDSKPEVIDESGIVIIDPDTLKMKNIYSLADFGPASPCFSDQTRIMAVGSLVRPEILLMNNRGNKKIYKINSNEVESIFSSFCDPSGLIFSTVFGKDRIAILDYELNEPPFGEIPIGQGPPLFEGPVDLLIEEANTRRLFFLMGIGSNIGFVDLLCIAGFEEERRVQ